MVVGTDYIEFAGVWRLAEINWAHLSLSHSDRATSMIWRIDGTRHGGPRGDWHAFGWNEFTKAKTPRNVRKG